MIPHPNPHIEATVRFLTAGEGGRSLPVTTGYQGRVWLETADHAAFHRFPDAAEVQPGETARVLITFAFPERMAPRPADGMSFSVREGPHVVATGTITKRLHAF